MSDRLLHHINSNVVGYVALFIPLGGTSYAAISIPARSVGTKQLGNGAVTVAIVRHFASALPRR